MIVWPTCSCSVVTALANLLLPAGSCWTWCLSRVLTAPRYCVVPLVVSHRLLCPPPPFCLYTTPHPPLIVSTPSPLRFLLQPMTFYGELVATLLVFKLCVFLVGVTMALAGCWSRRKHRHATPWTVPCVRVARRPQGGHLGAQSPTDVVVINAMEVQHQHQHKILHVHRMFRVCASTIAVAARPHRFQVFCVLLTMS